MTKDIGNRIPATANRGGRKRGTERIGKKGENPTVHYYNTNVGKKSRAFSCNRKTFLNYQDRLRGYERDKQKLLSESLPPDEYSDKLKSLKDKWRI